MRGVSVIVPIFNEEKVLWRRISTLIIGVRKIFATLPLEILLVENGSRDQSWAICQKLAKKSKMIRIFQLSQASYGAALKRGIAAARFETVAIVNVDFWDFKFLRRAHHLLAVCDIVNGSKALTASRDQRPWLRRQLTVWFNIGLRIAFGFPGTDTHGIKFFRRRSFLPLMKRCLTKNELFDTELVLRGCKQGLILAELPITVKEIRPTRYNPWRRASNTLADVGLIVKYKYGPFRKPSR